MHDLTITIPAWLWQSLSMGFSIAISMKLIYSALERKRYERKMQAARVAARLLGKLPVDHNQTEGWLANALTASALPSGLHGVPSSLGGLGAQGASSYIGRHPNSINKYP